MLSNSGRNNHGYVIESTGSAIKFAVEPTESPVSTPERWRDCPLILNADVKQTMFWHSQGRQLEMLRSFTMPSC